MTRCPTARKWAGFTYFSLGQDRAIMSVWCSGRSFPDVVAEFHNLASEFKRPFTDVARRVGFLISREAAIIGRVDPMQRAIYALGSRAAVDVGSPGGFVLDGRAVRAVDVINAANTVLAMIGEAEIDYPLIEIKGAA